MAKNRTTIRKGKIPLAKLIKLHPNLVVRDTNRRWQDRPEGDRYLTEMEMRYIVGIFYNRPITATILRKWREGFNPVGPKPVEIVLRDGLPHLFYDKREVDRWLHMSEVCRTHRMWGRYEQATKIEDKYPYNAIPNQFKPGVNLDKYNTDNPDALPPRVRRHLIREKKKQEATQRLRDSGGFDRLHERTLAAYRRKADRLDKRKAERMMRRQAMHRMIEE